MGSPNFKFRGSCIKFSEPGILLKLDMKTLGFGSRFSVSRWWHSMSWTFFVWRNNFFLTTFWSIWFLVRNTLYVYWKQLQMWQDYFPRTLLHRRNSPCTFRRREIFEQFLFGGLGDYTLPETNSSHLGPPGLVQISFLLKSGQQKAYFQWQTCCQFQGVYILEAVLLKFTSWTNRLESIDLGGESLQNDPTVDGSEVRLVTWDVQNLANNGIDYQPQLVNAGFLNHQQYFSQFYNHFGLGFKYHSYIFRHQSFRHLQIREVVEEEGGNGGCQVDGIPITIHLRGLKIWWKFATLSFVTLLRGGS